MDATIFSGTASLPVSRDEDTRGSTLSAAQKGMAATTYAPTHFRIIGEIAADVDECPLPTLAAAPRSAHGCTRLQCCRAFVRHAGHTLYGPESNRLVLPPHFQIGIAPPEGCAHFSLRQLPTRPCPPTCPTTSPTASSANLLPGSSCRVRDIAWRDRPPSAESRQHSPY